MTHGICQYPLRILCHQRRNLPQHCCRPVATPTTNGLPVLCVGSGASATILIAAVYAARCALTACAGGTTFIFVPPPPCVNICLPCNVSRCATGIDYGSECLHFSYRRLPLCCPRLYVAHVVGSRQDCPCPCIVHRCLCCVKLSLRCPQGCPHSVCHGAVQCVSQRAVPSGVSSYKT